MKANHPVKFDSLTEAHRALGLPVPKHPLISLINSPDEQLEISTPSGAHIMSFYKISYRSKMNGQVRYGQGYYDFGEGGLMFAAPNQLIGSHETTCLQGCSQITLLIHPDFLLNHPLAKKIRQYGFFSYSANEALHMSEQEKATILSIFKIIEGELDQRIDDFSQDVLIAQVELLLTYAQRFYKRQFITRKAVNNELLQKLEELLDEYFDKEKALTQGLPTVAYFADRLNMTPNYLSDMLRSLTGLSAQQHIHQKLIDKAKEILSTTTLSVSEIAYTLGFEHPQSFSKLFKTKTNLSPLEFRQSFN